MSDRLTCPECGWSGLPPRDPDGEVLGCPICRSALDDPDVVDHDDQDEEDERPWEEPGEHVRRDAEPHRGVLLLTLGIVTLVLATLASCTCGATGLVSLPMGAITWALAGQDLQRMRNRTMEPDQGQTNAGRICAMVGTILSLVIGGGCAAYFGLMMLGAMI